jgi:hypothetical protein
LWPNCCPPHLAKDESAAHAASVRFALPAGACPYPAAARLPAAAGAAAAGPPRKELPFRSGPAAAVGCARPARRDMEGPADRDVGVLTPEPMGDPEGDAVHPAAALVPGVPGLLSVVACASPPIWSRSMRFYKQQPAEAGKRTSLAQVQKGFAPC